MKKVLLFALVLLVGIAFVSTGFAQEKAKAPEKAKAAPEKPAAEKPAPAKEEKPAEAKEPEKAAEKPKPKPMPGFAGKVIATDTVFKTVTVERGKQAVTFDIADAKLKGYKNSDQITVGDKVSMLYKKGALTVIKIAGAKKAKAEKAVKKPAKKEKKEGAEEAKPADEKKPAKKEKKEKKAEKETKRRAAEKAEKKAGDKFFAVTDEGKLKPLAKNAMAFWHSTALENGYEDSTAIPESMTAKELGAMKNWMIEMFRAKKREPEMRKQIEFIIETWAKIRNKMIKKVSAKGFPFELPVPYGPEWWFFYANRREVIALLNLHHKDVKVSTVIDFEKARRRIGQLG